MRQRSDLATLTNKVLDVFEAIHGSRLAALSRAVELWSDFSLRPFLNAMNRDANQRSNLFAGKERGAAWWRASIKRTKSIARESCGLGTLLARAWSAVYERGYGYISWYGHMLVFLRRAPAYWSAL